jgi:hypothetical protein
MFGANTNTFLTFTVYMSCIEAETIEGKIYWASDEHNKDKERVPQFW